jgi:acyl-CoA synthetase (AMP-forming)/AMP-acid ligase II
MPDPRLGERACAFVTLHAGQALDFRGMIEYLCAQRMMTQYLPERLEVIDVFPRTPSGKIQKFKLRERARTLAPMSLPVTATPATEDRPIEPRPAA